MLMCKLLTHSNALCVLDISGNKIKSEEATCLANCRNILLQDLRMRWCGLCSVCADKIGEMLAHNKSIISIDLSRNHICDKGMERMVYHLKNGNTLQCINLSSNNVTAVGTGHLRELLVTNSTLTSLDLSHNNLKYEDVYLFLDSLDITMEYIGLYGYQFIPEAIAAACALDKVKSFGFFYYPLCESSDISKPVIACLKQLEVHIDSKELEIHHKMIAVISQSNNIQVLKISYNFMSSKMLQVLSTYVQQSQSLKELAIMYTGKCSPKMSFTKLLTVVINSSIKKIKCIGWMRPLSDFLEFQELFIRLPDTLEEATLRMHLQEKDLQKLVETLKEVNQLRTIKGASNPLQVNFSFESAEGFY